MWGDESKAFGVKWKVFFVKGEPIVGSGQIPQKSDKSKFNRVGCLPLQ